MHAPSKSMTITSLLAAGALAMLLGGGSAWALTPQPSSLAAGALVSPSSSQNLIMAAETVEGNPALEEEKQGVEQEQEGIKGEKEGEKLVQSGIQKQETGMQEEERGIQDQEKQNQEDEK